MSGGSSGLSSELETRVEQERVVTRRRVLRTAMMGSLQEETTTRQTPQLHWDRNQEAEEVRSNFHYCRMQAFMTGRFVHSTP